MTSRENKARQRMLNYAREVHVEVKRHEALAGDAERLQKLFDARQQQQRPPKQLEKLKAELAEKTAPIQEWSRLQLRAQGDSQASPSYPRISAPGYVLTEGFAARERCLPRGLTAGWCGARQGRPCRSSGTSTRTARTAAGGLTTATAS